MATQMVKAATGGWRPQEIINSQKEEQNATINTVQRQSFYYIFALYLKECGIKIYLNVK